jgi:hypothetical protein
MNLRRTKKLSAKNLTPNNVGLKIQYIQVYSIKNNLQRLQREFSCYNYVQLLISEDTNKITVVRYIRCMISEDKQPNI